MKKRLLSTLLALTLCLGPALPALAAEEDFVIEDGVLVAYNGTGGNVVIPDGVTEIGPEVFYGFFDFSGLKVTLPDSIRVIGQEAFCESALSSINLPEGLTTIEDLAFAECGSLTSVTLPSTLETIGNEAFDNCRSLARVSFSDGLEEIGGNAFSFCKLTQVDIPAGVTVGRNAFYGNPITKATLGGRNATKDELTAYFYDTPLYYGAGEEPEESQTPDRDPGQSSDPEQQTPTPSQKPAQDDSSFVIENGVLIRCTATSGTVTVPDGVTAIGNGEGRVFERGVLKVVLPDSVRTINEDAFWDSTVQEVNIPSGVTEIGMRAFLECTYLKRITIPNSVTKIGEQAFQNCTSLTGVTLPNTLTAVEAYAFCGCSALTSVTIPASVREIGENAFSSCGLTSVTLPKGLKKLGGGAFSGNALTSITLPDALEEMGTGVVSGCEDLTTITFPKTGKLAESMKGMTANQFMNYLGQCPSLKDVVNLPSEQLAGRLETFRALFDGVDPNRWVTEQSPAIVAKSNEITAGLTSDYEKAQAIHRWVAENVVYDYEYFRGKKEHTYLRSEDVLEHKLAVCSGYTNLTRALLQAQGIPTVHVHGTASGDGHAWNAAYIDGQWIWIDSTWGRPGNGAFYDPRYFDASDFFLAQTHEAFPPAASLNNFKAGDPKAEVTVEAELPDPSDLPSSWAQEQVDAAIRSGLVPEDLQTGYQNNITREEFCRLMVMLVEKKTGMSVSVYATVKGKTITDPFTDTDNADILAAHALGIVNGTSETTFNPSGSITRQEAASMLSRTAQVLDMTTGKGQSFNDEAQIAPWAKEGVAFTSGLVDPTTGDRVMGGTGDGDFSPLATYTREQAYLTALRLSHCGE